MKLFYTLKEFKQIQKLKGNLKHKKSDINLEEEDIYNDLENEYKIKINKQKAFSSQFLKNI